MPIIRFTTPTLKFTFSEINVADIATAYLVIKQNDRTVLERGLDSATADESSLSWTLTQEETGKLCKTDTSIVCDWKLLDGTRGRSKVKTEKVVNSGKNEVI